MRTIGYILQDVSGKVFLERVDEESSNHINIDKYGEQLRKMVNHESEPPRVRHVARLVATALDHQAACYYSLLARLETLERKYGMGS